MLDFALMFQPAIDTMTATHKYNLPKYELLPVEWKIAKELCDMLKVSCYSFIFSL